MAKNQPRKKTKIASAAISISEIDAFMRAPDDACARNVPEERTDETGLRGSLFTFPFQFSSNFEMLASVFWGKGNTRMTFFKRLKRKLWPYKYRFKHGEARIGRLEKKVESLQEQLRDLMETTSSFTGEFREMMAPLVPHQGAQKKVRVGSTEDGAYVMFDDFVGIEQAISLGVGKEIAWDLSIAGKGIPVLQFDPSVAGPSINHPLFQFHRKCLVGEISDPAREVLLASVIPAGKGANLLLKMDIEGAEWEVLDATKSEELARFRQVVVEFHDLHLYRQPQWRARARRVFEKMAATHRLVHVHGNNFNTTFAGGNRECPRDLEMTFALASYYDLSPSGEHFPGPLDRPNKAEMPDYKLGDFRF